MVKDYLRTLPQFILPKQGLTHFAGFLADVQKPAIKNRLIRWFIEKFNVDMSEAKEDNPENYRCFNEFFIRQLKPGCRPIAQADIVSPVDGVISEFGMITHDQILQAKGRYYKLAELLACNAELSHQFINGRFATFYLSPKDYHRVHMPMDATLEEMTYIPGKLFSVQPSTVRVVPHLFARNERLVCFFNTKIGSMAMVLVGATIVGAIGTRWQGEIKRSSGRQNFNSIADHADIAVRKGEEMGYFKLGSTVILLFVDNEKIHWQSDLHPNKEIRFGEALAVI